MGDITANFSHSEFRCNDGSTTPEVVIPNIERLAENLQVLRDFFGASVTVNSGYRSPEYNAKIGGASKSQHVQGRAGDVVVEGFTPDQVAQTIRGLIAIGAMDQGGVGMYKTFTHYDHRGTKARWDNR